MKQLLSCLCVFVISLVAVAAAGASDNSITARTVTGGIGQPLSSSPASACLTVSDSPAFTILSLDYTGFIHENLVGTDAVHIVADLKFTFAVYDNFGTHIAWQGSGEVSLNQVVPLISVDGVGVGTLNVTLPVLMTSSVGQSVNTTWPIQVFAFSHPDDLSYGLWFIAEGVTCS